MDNLIRNLSFLGGLIRGYVPALSPTIDDFELMQYLRQPLRPAANEFSILINVDLLELHEVEIHVLEGNKIEIHAKHPRKQNFDGMWMTRDAVYTYNLPRESCNKVLQAQWFADNFLLITTNHADMGEKEYVDRARLVIERVDIVLNPSIVMSVLKDFVEDIRDRAQETLRYLRFAVHNVPSSVEKDIQDMIDSGAVSEEESPMKQNEACSNADKD